MLSRLTIAWRNLWRNRKRTAITAAAIALNTAVLVSVFALIDGLHQQMLRNVTHVMLGHAQVHAPGYVKDRSMYKNVASVDEVLKEIDAAGLKATTRQFGYGLVALDVKSAGATFWGLDPATEETTFELPRTLLEGSFVPKQEPNRRVVLGRRLAKTLHAQLGDKIVAVVQAADGSLGHELFEVHGILKSLGQSIDRSAIMMHRKDFDELFVANGRIHEIAIRGAGNERTDQVVEKLHANLDTERYDIASWRQLMPVLSDLMNLNNVATQFFAFIFYLAAGLGVMNTMLMATHDRVPEFGVQKALGCSRRSILLDLSLEGLLLGLVSTAIGTIAGLVVYAYFRHHGIDLSTWAGEGFEFAGVAFNPVWKPKLLWSTTTQAIGTMWLISVLASLYPAIKAALLKPVEAMTHT